VWLGCGGGYEKTGKETAKKKVSNSTPSIDGECDTGKRGKNGARWRKHFGYFKSRT